jgi:hypothetical protein
MSYTPIESYQQFHTLARKARRDFMTVSIAIGHQALAQIKEGHPTLYTKIMDKFKDQPSRAAFWLAMDRLTISGPTPLQQLIKDDPTILVQRLDGYTPIKDR